MKERRLTRRQFLSFAAKAGIALEFLRSSGSKPSPESSEKEISSMPLTKESSRPETFKPKDILSEPLSDVNLAPTMDYPFGTIEYLDQEGRVSVVSPPLEKLQKGEKTVRFDEEKGAYEFLDGKDNILREKRIFLEVAKLTPTPTPTPIFEPGSMPTPGPLNPTPEPTRTPVPTPGAEVICTALHVREGPWGRVVGYLEKDDKVWVTGYYNGWYQVKLEKGEGWISAYPKYVLANEQAEKLTPIPKEKMTTPQRPSTPEAEKECACVVDTQNRNLSCELSASQMALSCFGIEAGEEQLIEACPLHENPHRGFRGNIDGPVYSLDHYGVYAEPIAEILRRYGVTAEVKYGVDYEDLRKDLSEGKAVIVWMSNEANPTVKIEKDPETGQDYKLVLGEHAILLAYEEGGRLRVFDPWKGGKYWYWQIPNWHLFNGMRVVVSKKEP